VTLPVFVIGVSHKTAPVDVRERFSASDEVVAVLLARLGERPELAEAMFVGTCNRVEIIALAAKDARVDDAVGAVQRVLADHVGAGHVREIAGWLYELRGDEATRHIFRVAASLDSMVLGEPQVLGQVKNAYDAAVAAGTLRGHLRRCVHHAFTVAKRVRSETQLGAGLVSISSVAVDLAKRIFGDLRDCTVLLVGAGEMAEQAARSLGKGAKAIRVCNRSFDRAASLAQLFAATAAPLEQLESELAMSDVIIASTASRSFVITRELVKRAMKQRKNKALFLIDIAVPRNIEPEVHQLDNVYVYNVDDLEREVADNMKARIAEVEAAEAIVTSELAQWAGWARGLNVNPTIVALRGRMRRVLDSELERSLSGRLKHLAPSDRDALAQMLDSATNKLLHSATVKLKQASLADDADDLVRAVHHLFDLAPDDNSATRLSSDLAQPSSGKLPASAPEPVALAAPVEAQADEYVSH